MHRVWTSRFHSTWSDNQLAPGEYSYEDSQHVIANCVSANSSVDKPGCSQNAEGGKIPGLGLSAQPVHLACWRRNLPVYFKLRKTKDHAWQAKLLHSDSKDQHDARRSLCVKHSAILDSS